jgi:hypothetical protein
MADVQVAEGMLEVRLTLLERFFALHANVIVPLSAVRGVFIVNRPFAELRGLRWPGTGIPGVVALGTWRFGGGKDFVAIYGQQRAVEFDLVGCEFDRLLIGMPNPESVVDRLARIC